MSLIEQIEVGGKTYNLAQASAVKQLTLTTLVGTRVLLNSMAISGDRGIDYLFIKGMLVSLPEETLVKVSDIILTKCFEQGGDRKIGIEDFQGRMNDFLELLAKGVMVNLGDFFTWCDSEKEKLLHQNPQTENQ